MFPFCPVCRHPSPTFSEGKRHDCTACGMVYYQNPGAAVIVVLHREGRVALCERAREPQRGLFDMPGGFVDADESAEHAVRREIREELGLELGAVTYLGSAPNVYPYRGFTYRTCDLIFAAALPPGDLVVEASEISSLIWVDPASVDPAIIAFTSVTAALDLFRRRA